MSDDGKQPGAIAKAAIDAAMVAETILSPFGGLPATDPVISEPEPTAIMEQVSADDFTKSPLYQLQEERLEDAVSDLADNEERLREQREDEFAEGAAEADYANEAPPDPAVAEYWDDVADAAFHDAEPGFFDAGPGLDGGFADPGAAGDMGGGFDGGGGML
jgi:hypothetical protein